MTAVKASDGSVYITFKPRTMRGLLVYESITSALDIDNLQSDTEKVLAYNFATLLPRTESIELCDTDSPSAKRWVKFWEHSKGNTKYSALFNEYLESLPVDVNNLWLEAYNDHEAKEAGRIIDKDLQSPELVPDEILEDETVKKRELASAGIGDSN